METPDRRVRRIKQFGRSAAGRIVLSCALAGTVAAAALAPIAIAQTAPAQRIVEGKVQLSSGAGAQGAIVYLKNAKTLEVRTYISTADGNYRFGQLSPDVDYTLWAEYQGKKSKEKTVSSFDTKKSFQIALTIDA